MNEKNEQGRLFPTEHLNPIFVNDEELIEFQKDEEEKPSQKLSAKAPNSKEKEIELINLDDQLPLLPKKVPYNNYCIQMTKNIPNSLDPELTVILHTLFEKMGEKLVIFDKNQAQNFSFKLPQTIFNEKEKFQLGQNKKKRSEVDEKQAEQADQGLRFKKIKRLSHAQMRQIWNTACFNTSSPLAEHDFTWKLSGWIFSGRKKIYNRFCDLCAFSLEKIYEMPSRFYEEKHRMRFCLPNAYSGLVSMYRCFLNIASLFVGYPKKVFKGVNSKKLKAFMLMQHMEKILNNINIDKTFYLFLDANNQNRRVVLEIEKDFDVYWKERKDILSSEFAVDDENYLLNLQELFYLKFYEFIDKSNKLSPDSKKSLINLIQAAVLINKFEFQNKCKADKKINEFYDNMKTKHTFLNRVDRWKEKKILNFEKLMKSTYKHAILDESCKAFHQTQTPLSCTLLLENYYDFAINFNENIKVLKNEEIKRLREKKENFSPYRTIEIKKYNYPPGKLKRSEENNRYYIEEYSENLIQTTTCCWRFKILVYRYWNWANNVTLFLTYNAINGQYGMKALVYSSEFFTSIKINAETGAIQPSGDSTETVISTFRNIMKSIKNSRQDFENSPDTGIFGKKFTRICNLFENYFYKFFLLGIVLDLICFPIVIILNTLLCFFLASTAYVWVFFVVVFFWFIQIFFYDFDNEGDPVGDASNSSQEFPLFFEIFSTFLLFGLIQILLSFLFVLIIYPFLMIIAIFLGILYYFVASVLDCLMIMIIFLLGREPQSNSLVAWKISGPGVTLDYFNQVELEDIFVSARAYLEKFELMVFNSKVLKLIDEPKMMIDSLYNQIFVKSLGSNKPEYPKEVMQIQSLLTEKLKSQVSQRQHCYPKPPKNVRLSAEELDIILSSSEKLIIEFVTIRKLEIVWKHFKLKKNEWKQLTKTIISQIFTDDILEPLEDLDKRVKLKAKQSNYYDKILEILKGENADTYKNLILKKKDIKNEIHYNEVPPYVKVTQLIKCENYLQTFINSLYIFTNLEMMNNVMIKEEKKGKENEEE